MMFSGATRSDAAAREWTIDDQVMRLREWGTDAIRVLPAPPVSGWMLGAGPDCAFRLDDPSGRVSRVHAALTHHDRRWLLRDLGSKNGMRIDGARRAEVALEPGVEIGIGGLTLIAESARSIALRGYLSRLLGWAADRAAIVDQALRAVRAAVQHRSALVVSGDGDLVPVAHAIHRRTLGDRPFVVCDPRRRSGDATVRSAPNRGSGTAAFAVARGGSVCVRTRRLPDDFAELLAAVRDPDAGVQLVVCVGSAEDYRPYTAAPIVVPPLARRAAELDMIIAECIDDARTELGLPRAALLASDRAWIRGHAPSLPEIEKAALRLLALRRTGSVAEAADRLGMAEVSLARWLGRRKLAGPTPAPA